MTIGQLIIMALDTAVLIAGDWMVWRVLGTQTDHRTESMLSVVVAEYMTLLIPAPIAFLASGDAAAVLMWFGGYAVAGWLATLAFSSRQEQA
ncbi:hypothetical protein L3X40_05830 [Rhizorhapis sp. SPR117]|nr:hypothetical protein [Rhizorhapis sp. SPR117]